MDLFVSQFVNKVDKKGRISLPSLFRNVLPKDSKNEIILYKSFKYNSIEGCSSDRINEIAERINNATVYIDCLMTESRFHEVKSLNQKVLFKKIK